ncbi:unnamed protein product [Blepharisma stoltei]|uniref:SMP-30/Gluconolactonase/LRE-like region domain-containing protein n=1 Tax=Blepharisma stoltei TaxID=1481888 RepID=A0AAU9IUS0_9CILI|nr:unnamed protein product [Blepharisma stoltei]
MEDLQIGPFEPMIEGILDGIWSVTEDVEGNVYAVCQTGYVYSIVDRQCQELYYTGGQPNSLCFDGNNTAYIADMAHQRVLCHTDNEGKQEVTEIVKDYEGKPLLGPNSLALSEQNNYLYFTDSGPIGETSIASPSGSIFAADLELLVLKPLALNCLAHPTGIAISSDGKTIFVAEMYRNRILRLSQNPSGVHHMSVFYQFSGRLGPSALAISENGLLYVANYDFADYSRNGLISILNMEGQLLNTVTVPNAPEITGLYFSKTKPGILYITESTTATAYRVTVPSDHA